jgi:hypothetical protein
MQLRLLTRRDEMQIQLTIEIPDAMARALEARTRRRIDAELVELALRVYYMGLVAPPLFPEEWSQRTKIAMYGDGREENPLDICPVD